MTEAKSTEQIDGRTVTLLVDLESGLWTATHDHEIIAHANTRDVVVKKARLALRRKKVRLAIEATLVDVEGTGKPVHIIIVGLHAQNNDILYQAGADKRTGRLSHRGWGHDEELCPRLTHEELTEFVTLRKAARDAAGALEKWQKTHVIGDREQFVKDAIEAQVAHEDKT